MDITQSDSEIPYAVSYHALKAQRIAPHSSKISTFFRDTSLRSLRTHIISLAISSLFYLVAFIILVSPGGPEKGTQIAKIILWFSPILLEIGAHYSALTQTGHVPYPARRFSERCAAAFVIILGGGRQSDLYVSYEAANRPCYRLGQNHGRLPANCWKYTCWRTRRGTDPFKRNNLRSAILNVLCDYWRSKDFVEKRPLL